MAIPPPSLLTRRRQLFAQANATDAFLASTISGGSHVVNLVDALKPNYDVKTVERSILRAQIGQVDAIKGPRMAKPSFGMEVIGAGTAGAVPEIGLMLRGCGMSQTINAGVASVGAARERANNLGAGNPPALTGTFGGTKTGMLRLLIVEVVTNTSIKVRATFYPSDFTARSTAEFNQTSAAAVALTAVATGVSFDFGDPSSSTAGYVVGDEFVADLTSSSENSVTYKTLDDGFEWLDLAALCHGNLHKFYGAMGTFNMTGKIGDLLKSAFDFSAVPAGFDEMAMVTSGISAPGAVPKPFTGIIPLYDGSTPRCFSNFSIDIGNTVAMLECAAAATGYERALITERNAKLTFDPESQGFNTFNPYADLFGSDVKVFNLQHGTTPGNIVIFSARGNTIDVKEGDRNGNATDEITLMLSQPLTDDGDGFSEFSITFK